ncbi:MAG: DNA methyltransferase [Candidatus Thorarchaeota archaeon]
MEKTVKIRNYAFKQKLGNKIPPKNYLTHNLYSYPAKFIPHVPYYVISKYMNNNNGIVLDPFAGSSSTAIEALHQGQNIICIDINPLTNFLTKVKTQRISFNLDQQAPLKLDVFLEANPDMSEDESKDIIHLRKIIKQMSKSDEYFIPRWKNIDHWYPMEFKHTLAQIWGFIYSIEDKYPEEFMNLIKLTALYISRFLSYAARDVPKLFRSKRRIKQVEELRKKVRTNPNIPYETFHRMLIKYYNQMIQLTKVLIKKNITPDYEEKISSNTIRSVEANKRKIVCLGGTDVLSLDFSLDYEFIDLIITSPPYIYAQEYIRSTKLDLYWLDLVDDIRVRELTKRELGTKIDTDIAVIKTKLQNIDSFSSIMDILEKCEKEKDGKCTKYALQTYTYFYNMYEIIEKMIRYLKERGVFGLFVGNPTVLGFQIPCHKIFFEIFQDLGLTIKEFGYDEIVSPRLLKGRQNLSPDGMKAEWLIIGQK